MSLWKNFIVAMTLVGAVGCAHNSDKGNQDYLLASTLWVQTSAEWKALSYQAFKVARDRLDVELKKGNKRDGKPLAIVVDADETVLDNSEFQASVILNNHPYDAETWKAWVEKARAVAMPGAQEYLSYAASKGVDVFYITNRKDYEYDATLKNLKAVGFPVRSDTLLVRTKASNKEERRQLVAKKYAIVQLLGDNMNDFSELYEKKSVADRARASDQLQKEFGRKMILLPNPMYGDWESAIYDYKFDRTEAEKAQVRKKALRPIP